jgi:hypothetical protein
MNKLRKIYLKNSIYNSLKKKPSSKLDKGLNYLYKENYKSLKRLRKTTEGGEISHAHGLVDST